MDEQTYKHIIQTIAVVIGVVIPIIVVLFNRVIKDQDKKVEKLFSLCDQTHEILIENTVRIAQHGIEILALKEEMHRTNK